MRPRPAARMLPGERRALILETALKMLETRPIDELGVGEVAAGVGVSPGLLFHYFGSKKGLHEAILRTGTSEALARMKPDPELTLSEQVRYFTHALLDSVTQYPTAYPTIVRLASGGDREMRALHEQIRDTVSGWFVDALTDAGIRTGPALPLALRGCQAFIEEAVLAWLDHPEVDRSVVVGLCERCCQQAVLFSVDDPDSVARLLDHL
ncbi:TetR/AcrR family transcriptional regulator [Amycolatopsis nigrescens]|uniref:TetR/AcrR family transcriptional regulator n=1 Tax=Amycolatopsis nigrescens TaxID=381445 RepID=UPI000475424B|nr:TetR/AcrR family transcriptional regulator [Amycolatopsis nigrescens]